jgi:hypothetical protein
MTVTDIVSTTMHHSAEVGSNSDGITAIGTPDGPECVDPR